MEKIYVLVGKSATGKDSIYKRIIECKELVPITGYTTRPQRTGETDGKDYYFVTEKEIRNAETKGKLIEKRTYETAKGLWTYATIEDGQFDTPNNGIIILPPQGYRSFVEHFGQDKVIPIYIVVPDGIRLRRAIERDEQQDVPNYEETCRRFLSDAKDFAGFADSINPKHIFENNNLEECVQAIIKEIGGNE